MYGSNIVTGGLTLGKVLSGISRGLTIANQVIPLYQQAKPMISNARKVMSVLKEFNNTKTSNTNKPVSNISSTKKEANSVTSSNNLRNSNLPNTAKSIPVFFQ